MNKDEILYKGRISFYQLVGVEDFLLNQNYQKIYLSKRVLLINLLINFINKIKNYIFISLVISILLLIFYFL